MHTEFPSIILLFTYQKTKNYGQWLYIGIKWWFDELFDCYMAKKVCGVLGIGKEKG